MALIGDFEAAVHEADPTREPDTFRLNGQTFTVADDLNIVALGRFARAARDGADTNDMEGLASLVETVASLVIDEDQTRLLDTASKHRAQPDLLLEILQAVLVSQTGKDSEQPSVSSSGSSSTGPSSRVLLSSAAPSTPSKRDWRDTPFGRRELDPETGHPELYSEIASISELGQRVSQGA